VLLYSFNHWRQGILEEIYDTLKVKVCAQYIKEAVLAIAFVEFGHDI
jgi:hypothetical protein